MHLLPKGHFKENQIGPQLRRQFQVVEDLQLGFKRDGRPECGNSGLHVCMCLLTSPHFQDHVTVLFAHLHDTVVPEGYHHRLNFPGFITVFFSHLRDLRGFSLRAELNLVVDGPNSMEPSRIKTLTNKGCLRHKKEKANLVHDMSVSLSPVLLAASL